MACLSEHHKTLTNGEGKCSVPMWLHGCPGGFCDRPAFGEQTQEGKLLYTSYVPALACENHGGPGVRISKEEG